MLGAQTKELWLHIVFRIVVVVTALTMVGMAVAVAVKLLTSETVKVTIQDGSIQACTYSTSVMDH